jgi:hypothetical protein
LTGDVGAFRVFRFEDISNPETGNIGRATESRVQILAEFGLGKYLLK